ncbi:MAG: type II toxin-antitoxin system VapC family toxin [Treponema sp.]|nr:type II toxin-antitoxin system VapC family toxin [Treponema sp.]
MTAENTEFPCFVADTSFMAAYLLNGLCADELKDCIKDVEYVLQNNGQFYVPALFWYEIENVLLVKTRKTRDGQAKITKTDAMDILYDLQCLPIYTDPLPDGEIRQRIFDLAEEHNLSYYDASYLELAHRYNLPLKTYDEALKTCR